MISALSALSLRSSGDGRCNSERQSLVAGLVSVSPGSEKLDPWQRLMTHHQSRNLCQLREALLFGPSISFTVPVCMPVSICPTAPSQASLRGGSVSGVPICRYYTDVLREEALPLVGAVVPPRTIMMQTVDRSQSLYLFRSRDSSAAASPGTPPGRLQKKLASKLCAPEAGSQ